MTTSHGEQDSPPPRKRTDALDGSDREELATPQHDGEAGEGGGASYSGEAGQDGGAGHGGDARPGVGADTSDGADTNDGAEGSSNASTAESSTTESSVPEAPAAALDVATRERDAPVRQVRVPAFRIAFTGMLGAGLGWWLLQGITTIATVLTYAGIAIFLTLGLEPLVRFLERRNIKRGLAVVIVAVAFVLVAAGVLLLIVPTVVRQIQDFIGNLPNLINEIAEQEWVADLEHNFQGAFDIDKMVASASTWASDPANLVSVGGGIVSVGSAIAGGTTGALIVVILTVYFSITLPAIKDWAYALVPKSKRGETANVAEEIMSSVGGYVLGQVSLAAVNGVLSAIFLLILHAPLPALLALVAFLGSMIPLVGTISASVVIVLSCLFVSPSMAIIAAIYYLVYMQIEAYVLSPRIMRAAVNVPGALVIIGAVAGATIAGVLGAILAVPVTASLIIIVRRVVIPIQAAK